eukprot:jgi/Ulvmu1/3550/UM166_0004.1
MGVKVRFDDLRPLECDGSTYDEHCKVVEAIEGQVVAIDASQWVFQAYQGARSRQAQDAVGFTEAIRLSAITLIFDRVSQILRYGGHPIVVLDGQPPRQKARAAQWTGRGPHAIHAMVDQLCDAMDVCHIRAPGEGEALCAALNDCGVADVCFSTDVIDIFFFGAKKVMRSSSKGDQTKAKFLTYHDPPNSSFALLTADMMASYIGPNVKREHIKDVALFFAALVGTDYNTQGLPAYGKDKAKAVTHWMYQQWLQTHASGGLESGFLSFSLHVVEGKIIRISTDPVICTFLRKAKEDSRPEVSFVHDLKLVIEVVHAQRAKAYDLAKDFHRDDVLWTGEMVDHRQLMTVLINANIEQEQENGVNGVLSRIMKIEAERMLRLGEASTCRPLLRIETIAKPKEVKKWQKGHAKLSQPRFYQYLLNLSIQRDCDIRDGDVKANLVQYADQGNTWVAGARVARESAIADKWPSVLRNYQHECAEKQRKASVSKSVNARGKAAAKQSVATAHPSITTVHSVRTAQGTRDIQSLLLGPKTAIRNQSTVPCITANQANTAHGGSQGVQAENDQHNVLPEKENALQGCGDKLAECSGVAFSTQVAAYQTTPSPSNANSPSGSPLWPISQQQGSQRSQRTNIFACMPDVIEKQPSVFFEARSGSTTPAQGPSRHASPPLSPGKRLRARICESVHVPSSNRAGCPAESAAIDLTLSTDDDEHSIEIQGMHRSKAHNMQHETPKKRRASDTSSS